MKKVISIILAVMMLASICVPVFAADITKDTPKTPEGKQEAKSDVMTNLTKTDGSDAYTYSVTIPASVEVAWGDTNPQTTAKYTVTSQLKLGDKLKVTAVADNEGVMTATGTTSTLKFTVQNGEVAEYPEVNKDVNSATTVTIADFSGVPIAEYTGTMTYKVEYVPHA